MNTSKYSFECFDNKNGTFNWEIYREDHLVISGWTRGSKEDAERDIKNQIDTLVNPETEN